MTDQAIESTAKQLPASAVAPWLVGATVYVLLLALGPRLLSDPDSYSHIAVGRLILSHGTLPTSDPFSFSMHGAPWIAFEWLSEVIYATVYAFAGWNGVVAFASAMIALAIGLLIRFLLRKLPAAMSLLIVDFGRDSFGAAFAGAAACADATGDGCLGGCACGLYGPPCGPARIGRSRCWCYGPICTAVWSGAWADWTGCT